MHGRLHITYARIHSEHIIKRLFISPQIVGAARSIQNCVCAQKQTWCNRKWLNHDIIHQIHRTLRNYSPLSNPFNKYYLLFAAQSARTRWGVKCTFWVKCAHESWTSAPNDARRGGQRAKVVDTKGSNSADCGRYINTMNTISYNITDYYVEPLRFSR